MQTVTLEALQEDFERYFDLVTETGEPLLITSPTGDVVMVSKQKYQEMQAALKALADRDAAADISVSRDRGDL